MKIEQIPTPQKSEALNPSFQLQVQQIFHILYHSGPNW